MRLPHAQRRPRRRSTTIAIALGALVVLGADAFVLTQRDVTTVVGFDATLSRFRSERAADPARISPLEVARSLDPTAETGSPVANGAPGSSAPVVRPAPVARPAAPAPGTTVAPPSAAPPGPFTLPVEGVYAYATSGGESISVAGAHHDYPAETFTTVRHVGGCRWEAEARVIKEHVDRRLGCSQPGETALVDEGRQVSFFGQTDGADYVCNPVQILAEPTDGPGIARDAVCADGHGSFARIHTQVVGHQPVAVGGVPADAVHLVAESRLTGRATGTGRYELWLDPQTGLLFQQYRDIDTVADTAFGAQVRYQEHARFTLESRTPRT